MDKFERVYKTQYTEQFTPTATGVKQYFFPDMAEVRDAPILGVETYDVNDVPHTFLGNVPVSTVDLKNSYLILYFDGGTFITIPCISIVTTRDSATSSTNHPFNQFKFLLAGQTITWQKSYVWISDLGSLTTGRYFHFVINYMDRNTYTSGKY